MTRLTLFLALLIPLNLWAQDEMPAEEEPARRYTVEIIIFTYEENVSVGSEIFVPDVVEDELTLFDEVAEDAESQTVVVEEDSDVVAAGEDDAGETPPLEWVLLEESELTMSGSYGRLERLQAYEPVMHFGWTQPTYPEDVTTAIPLHAFGRPPATLNGSFSLYMSRFLHLVVDLEMDAQQELPTYYRINENRIIRNNEVRYFDHPKFGVIAKVTRAEDVAEDALDEQADLTGGLQ